jgi:Fic family protein
MGEAVLYHLGKFPPSDVDWARLVPLIGQANAAIARYDGLVAAMPAPDVLLSPLTTQEAVLSSKIEGTNVTIGEVLEIEAGGEGGVTQPKRDDAEEIRNYRRALRFAAGAIKERHLTPHLLRETHAILMRGVRGRDKDPGAFRSEQNWIGRDKCPITEASFVPIPQEHLQSGLDAWSNYAGSKVEKDPLAQLAIVHAEFEALHPFKDGNGRLGRMIIPLYLFEQGVLSGPNFYMSDYLESRREEYIERLRSISRDGDWTNWIAFFLEGLIDQAKSNQSKATAILHLYQSMRRRVTDLTHSQFSGATVDFIFSNPIFASPWFIDDTSIPKESAQRIIRALKEAGIIRVLREASGRRPALHVFSELLNIAEGKAVA